MTLLKDDAVEGEVLQHGCDCLMEHESTSKGRYFSLRLDQGQIEYIAGQVPGGIDNIQDIYPLSPLQEGILFHHLLNDRGDTYVLSTLLELKPDTEVKDLAAALQKVIDRHEVLRSAVIWESQETAIQVVYRSALLEVEHLSLSSPESALEKLKELMQPRGQRWALERAPLVKLRIAGSAADEVRYALLQLHHLVCDHKSMVTLVGEAIACFQRRVSELPVPDAYRTYVHACKAAEAREEAEAFFRRKLKDVSEPTLPFGVTDVREDGNSVREAQLEMDPMLVRRARAAARCLGVTPARLFHAAWALVVAHCSGRDDVVFGTVVLSEWQRRARERCSLGMFVNTLPLRLRLGELSVREFVAHTHCELAELVKYDTVALHTAQACSGVVGGTPLFGALLNYRHSEREAAEQWQRALGFRVLATSDGLTNYPVTLLVDDFGDEALLRAQTDPSIDPARVLGYVVTGMQSLVNALEYAPEVSIRSLSILPYSERNVLIESFNSTQERFPKGKRVHQLFEEQAAQSPGDVAVVFEDDQVSYFELNARANQLARYLRQNGAKPEQLVAIYMERSIEMVVALMGVLKAGAAYVPLDPTYPQERITGILSDALPSMVLTQGRLRDRIPTSRHSVVSLDDQWCEMASHSVENLGAEIPALGDDCLAYVIYTSGSTGRPKGAMNEHRGVVNRLLWMQSYYGMSSEDRVLQKTPFSFDVSVWEFFWTLMSGARLIVARPEGHKDPSYLQALIQAQGVTTLHFVPSMLYSFLEQPGVEGCHTLRRIVCSGEELPSALQKRCLEIIPQAQLSNLYGPTEAAVDVTSWMCHAEDTLTRVPIGRPISNVWMYVFDGLLSPTPLGVPGELYIGGTAVGRGYLGRPELTAERFVADPFSLECGARLYRTGDLGRWSLDGSIDYLGRNDHQVKIRGFRIEIGEIEAQLARHPLVKESVVVAVGDEPETKRLVAYVTTRDVVGLIEQSRAEILRGYLKTVLPDYMVPNAILLLEKMPLTANGKVNRRALPAPETLSQNGHQYEAPEGEAEEGLAAIWRDLLRLKQVSRNDNFFELGGHSLLIVKMAQRLLKKGISVEIRQVFEHPLLADLARVLTRSAVELSEVPDNLIPSSCEAITPQMLPLISLTAESIKRIVQGVSGGAANIQDIYPLAPLQEGILFQSLRNQHETDAYARALLFSLVSYEKLEQFIAALRKLVERHDVLRTAFMWEGLPQPVQVVCRQVKLPTSTLQLDSERDVLEQLKEWMRPERFTLNLRQAPLLHLQIVPSVSESKWYALLRTHHVICDNQSLEIMLSEIGTLLDGEGSALPDPVPYRNHIAEVIARSRHDDSEGFFRSRLSDVVEPTAVFGLTEVNGDGSKIETCLETLGTELGTSLRVEAKRLGVTAATLFHAAWSLVVGCASGRDDVVFGSVLLGRLQGRTGAQQVLGMFVNTLPLRLRLEGMTARELIRQTHRQLADLLGHEQASLAMAQRCSGITGSMPLFTALLNYRHVALHVESHWSKSDAVSLLAIHGRTNYPAVLSVNDFGDRFVLEIETDRRIDPHQMLSHVQTALDSLVSALRTAPETPALALPILPEKECCKVIEEFNSVHVSSSDPTLIHELFEAQAARAPTAVAATCGGESLTYGRLNHRANQLARYLRKRGLGPDHLVALCVERSLDMVVGLLAILKAGAAYLPVDPNYPTERIAYLLEHSAPKLLLTQQGLQDRFVDTNAEVIVLDAVHAEFALEESENLDSRSLGVQSSNLAYVIYTSGSTGQPKGVMIEHRNVTRLFKRTEAWFGFNNRDVWTLFHSIAFDFSVWELWGALLYGGKVVIVPYMTARSPLEFYHLICNAGVTVLNQTPSAFRQLMDVQEKCVTSHNSLRVVIFGGEALELQSLRPWIDRNGVECPRLVNMYGITETTVHVTFRPITMKEADSEGSPVGIAIPDLRTYLLDRHGRPVPIGVTGEIYVGGAGVARGYLSQGSLTAERFIPDRFGKDPTARLYKTGDLGRWSPEGAIEYLGRNDEQVKIRGFRIELGEIEAQLIRHRNVKDAVVVVRQRVSGDRHLAAYVIPQDLGGQGAIPDARMLREHLKCVLPDYMLPTAFVVVESFPLTPNGKLDRRALPAPENDAYASHEWQPPVGAVEEGLAEIWQELLNIPRVGRQESFFDLGGHSILALRALLKINRRFDSDLHVQDLYRAPTLTAMAARIYSEAAEEPLVDLAQESALEANIVAASDHRGATSAVVLLTGCTGFVGRFLLAQLLRDPGVKIYCLVRAKSTQQAATRLKATLVKWRLWKDEYDRRVVAICGDMGAPALGLSAPVYHTLCREIDSIYHCATSMNHLESYMMAKPQNVDGVRELLRIASHGRPKLVNYISTQSVFSSHGMRAPRVVSEDSPIEYERHPASNGYAASKWVGEKILMNASERGIPCNIFRLGLVWADSRQGRYDELQREYRLVESCLESGYGIRNYRFPAPPTPVDYVTRSIVFLANQHPQGQGIFHLSSPESQKSDEVFESYNRIAGLGLELLSFYDWICEIKAMHAAGRSLSVVPLVEFAFSMNERSFNEYLERAELARITFDCSRTYQELEIGGITARAPEADSIRAYLDGILSRRTAMHDDSRRRLSGKSYG